MKQSQDRSTAFDAFMVFHNFDNYSTTHKYIYDLFMRLIPLRKEDYLRGIINGYHLPLLKVFHKLSLSLLEKISL